jgi:hypothetical protein
VRALQAVQENKLTLTLQFFSKVFFSRGETAVEFLRRVRIVFGSKTDMSAMCVLGVAGME